MVRNRSVGTLLVALAALAFFGCAHKKHARLPGPPAPSLGHSETGVASWYGHPYHGRPAANGEIYDMEQLVAAHRTLPFDTWVRVTNQTNGKSVEVRIIDRGPFVGGRIIDLSHAAAQAIDLIGPGVGPVRIEVIRLPQHATAALFAVQVGAFRVRANAENLRAEMAARYGSARIVSRPGSPDMWRVLVGAETSEEAASALARRIRTESSEKYTGFIVRIDSV
jgi:rare lipoprotein A